MFIRRVLNMSGPQSLVWKVLPRLIGDVRTRGLVRRFRHSWFHRRKIEKAPLSAGLRRQLEAEFEPDVARLSQMLDRDLGQLWFGRPSAVEPARESQSVATS